ncbi:MAG: TSUP family transporter [Leadbetterella sp.]
MPFLFYGNGFFMDYLHSLVFYQWVFIGVSAFLVGISKAGIRGLDAFHVVLMALVFGGKVSTGVILPLLCTADILAVIYYKKSVEWRLFLGLLPSMLLGLGLGLVFGKQMDEVLFKKIMGGIVIVTLLLLFRSEIQKKPIASPNSKVFTHSMGLVAGFTTMIGNLAGAFANIYFLGLKISKAAFLGTVAWVFLVINLVKVPLQIFVWKNISFFTFKVDLALIPVVVLGFWIGVKLVGKINEELFRKVVLILTIVGSVFLLAST